MRAYSLSKAKEIVATFNELKSGERVAEKLRLPVRDIKQIITWLDTYDPCNKRPDRGNAMRLAIPTSHIWVVWLYENNISPQTTSACVNWPYARVLRTCGGKKEWLKTCGRKRVAHPKQAGREEQGRMDGDPTETEIWARAAELRRDPGSSRPKRVEIRSYVYDGRDSAFKAID